MAKSAKATGTSRIKFIMFDAEIADDQIQSVTQAITNALRGPAGAPTIKRIAAPIANGTEDEPEIEAELEEAPEDEVLAPARQRGPRKVPKSPKVVDIEMHEPVSLASFAQGKESGSQAQKYLIAATWMKEHRGLDAVTEGHIFTCFKSLGWSTGIADFSQPLRDLKKRQFIDKTAKGWEINHLGVDYVKKLGGTNGAE